MLWYKDLKQALTQIHDVVSANGTVVDDNVPGPQSYSVPLDSIRFLPLLGPDGGITFLTSNLFLPSGPVSAPDFADLTTLLDFAGTEGPASGMSTSAMATFECYGTFGCAVLRQDVERRWKVEVTSDEE